MKLPHGVTYTTNTSDEDITLLVSVYDDTLYPCRYIHSIRRCYTPTITS